MRDRVRDNEDLLLLYLSHLDTDGAVLLGGYRIAGTTSPTRDVAVEKLIPKSPYEQLALRIGERSIA